MATNKIHIKMYNYHFSMYIYKPILILFHYLKAVQPLKKPQYYCQADNTYFFPKNIEINFICMDGNNFRKIPLLFQLFYLNLLPQIIWLYI